MTKLTDSVLYPASKGRFGQPVALHAFRVHKEGQIVTLAELHRWTTAMMRKPWTKNLQVWLEPNDNIDPEASGGGPLIQIEIDGITSGPTVAILTYREPLDKELP